MNDQKITSKNNGSNTKNTHTTLVKIGVKTNQNHTIKNYLIIAHTTFLTIQNTKLHIMRCHKNRDKVPRGVFFVNLLTTFFQRLGKRETAQKRHKSRLFLLIKTQNVIFLKSLQFYRQLNQFKL